MLKKLRLGIAFSWSFLLALPFNQDMVYLQPKTGEVMRDEHSKSVPSDYSKRVFPPVEQAMSAQNPLPATARTILLGKRLFLANCSQCHGVYLDGQYRSGAVQPFVYGLDLSTADMKVKPDGHFYSSILYGFPQIGDVKVMNPYRYRFSDYEAWSIVTFIREMQRARADSER